MKKGRRSVRTDDPEFVFSTPFFLYDLLYLPL